MSNEITNDAMKITGEGTFEPPPGLTLEDCERLAREADEARKEQ